jgi:hypothetical protein
LTGDWNVKIVDKEYDGVNGTVSVEKNSFVATIGDDNAGTNSALFITLTDSQQGKIVLTGRRCGKGFAAVHTGPVETITVSGTAAITKAGKATLLTGKAVVVGDTSVVLSTFTAKKVP